jgi:hypothetical protein
MTILTTKIQHHRHSPPTLVSSKNPKIATKSLLENAQIAIACMKASRQAIATRKGGYAIALLNRYSFSD